MIRTQTLPCILNRELADSLNRESGRIYTGVMVSHWRALRHSGHWTSPFRAMKWADWRDREVSALLHSHSIDAAQEGFYKACKTAKACKDIGGKYPRKRKMFRTTVWKNTGIRKRDGHLTLSLARGQEPVKLVLPSQFAALDAKAFVETRLVYDIAQAKYEWHLVIEDGKEPEAARGTSIAAIDLGEIHPAVATDGTEGMVFSCRELRSIVQGREKRLASITSKLSKLQKGSRRWKQLKARKAKFLAKQDKRRRDLEHKVSRSVVNWAKERNVGALGIGDVGNIADKTKVEKRLNAKTRQKVSSWSHGKMRQYIGYKAAAVGIEVNDKISEKYTSQTCPQCGTRKKPRGRNYSCSCCGFRGHRDIVGASNILSRFINIRNGEPEKEIGGMYPPSQKYRRPFQKWNQDGVVARHGASGLA
jgi:putative transposase